MRRSAVRQASDSRARRGSLDEKRGADRVVLLSSDLWQRRCSGDPAILGRSISPGSGARRALALTLRIPRLLSEGIAVGEGRVMLVAQKSDTFAQIPLFSSLSPAELRALAGHVVERRLGPGDVLFREGDECCGLHVLAAGSVKIVRTSAAGREIVIYVETAPSSVAEIPLFDGGPYPATACALDTVVCYVLDRDTFRALCAEHPDICQRILAGVGHRLRKLVALIESLSFGGVRQRLARMLLEFRDDAGDDTFSLPLTLQEMAFRLGTVREVISRNMSRLQAHGVIRMRKREVVILDRHALMRDAETEF